MSIRVTVTQISPRSSARAPRSVVVRVPGPQGLKGDKGDKGNTGTAQLGTVSVLNPNQNPTVSQSGTPENAVYSFGLPRAPSFTIDDNVVLPNVDPSVAATVTEGDVELDFALPRAPTFTVGTVTAVAQGSEAIANVGTDGDIVLNFSVPKGDTGEQGIQGIQGIQGEQGIQGIQGIQGETGLQGIQGVPGEGVPVGGGIGQVIVKQSATDYDTAWEDPVAAIASLTDVDEGSGFEDGNVLIYDAAFGVWVPGEPAAGAKGGGDDKVFWENDQTVDTNYSITAGQNAGTFGPVTIQSGVTVTVPAGSDWTIV